MVCDGFLAFMIFIVITRLVGFVFDGFVCILFAVVCFGFVLVLGGYFGGYLGIL